MYKIAVLGDYDSIYGFGAIGMDTFPVTDPEEGIKTLRAVSYTHLHVNLNTKKMEENIINTNLQNNKYKH